MMVVVPSSFLCVLLCVIISQGCAEETPYTLLNSTCSNDRGNYTANSTYNYNLMTVLTNLTSNTKVDYGFYNSSYGKNTDKVNVIGMCRGDATLYHCRLCLNDIIVLLTQHCLIQKEAIGWSEDCMLRYSDRSIFGVEETSPSIYLSSPAYAVAEDQYNEVVQNLTNNLRITARAGDYRHKYATGEANGPKFQNVYGYVQCTPDLSARQCDDCLVKAISEIPVCCSNLTGGRVLKPSCNIRFESYPFFGSDAPSPSPSPSPIPPPSPVTNDTPSEGQGKCNKSRATIIIALAAAAAVVVLGPSFICLYLRMRKPEENTHAEGVEDEILASESLQLNFDTIRVATSDFSNSNRLGQGGFGAVYRGVLSNGLMIAVKRLSRVSSQGATEFKNEVLLLAKLQHRNLVKLLGFCLQGNERLLAYEFVPNKSLDYFIFDPIKKGELDWIKRYRIIRGIARGLLYLHEDSRLRIIHRDLKASNILLDEEMNPKIADFGLAKLFIMDQTEGSTSRIIGTYGYMAPEYAMHGQFSAKSDVYSFGVVLLEILSGRKNTGHGENEEGMLSFAWRNWREGTPTNIIDPSLNNSSLDELLRCVHVALLCVQENPADRPTMASIGLMLYRYPLTLPVPLEPSYIGGSGTQGFLFDMQSGEHTSRGTTSQSTIRQGHESENEGTIRELFPISLD